MLTQQEIARPLSERPTRGRLAKESSSAKVVVIIPAFNEEASIETVVFSVIEAGYDYVVVNDGSKDLTLDICRENGFNVLNLEYNLGIGGAVQAGLRYASQNHFDIAVQLDGDGQHDVSSIPTLIDSVLSGSDLVIGSRFISSDNTFRSTTMRRLGIKWLQLIIKIFCGVDVSDCTSGFRAFSRRAMRFFSSEYPTDYPEPESIALAVRRGLKVCEAPVIMHERQGGVSSINRLSSIYYMVKVSIAIGIASRREG